MQLRSATFQFKVTLKGIRPPIWRRIQIRGTSTFWDLHVAIQDAMGWMDCHLHEFVVLHPEWDEDYLIGIPDDWGMGPPVKAGWRAKVADFLTPGQTARYLYDYGDHWEHKILFEKVEQKAPKTRYPRCLGGRRACPPEDVGGIWGYEELLEVLGNPDDERHGQLLEWVGGSFDPDAFDARRVHFSNPKERLQMIAGV